LDYQKLRRLSVTSNVGKNTTEQLSILQSTNVIGNAPSFQVSIASTVEAHGTHRVGQLGFVTLEPA